MKYNHIFIDLDRTLYDFDKSTRETFIELFEKFRLKENGIHDPSILNRIEKLTDQVTAMDMDGVRPGKIFSIVDILKETNKALHEKDVREARHELERIENRKQKLEEFLNEND